MARYRNSPRDRIPQASDSLRVGAVSPWEILIPVAVTVAC